ncbi:MAG: CBS domain-containing protein [Nanoarchaeota archaeon]
MNNQKERAQKKTRLQAAAVESPAEHPKHAKRGTVVKEIGSLLQDIEHLDRRKNILYFSKLLRRHILDSKGILVGKVKDFSIAAGEKFPEVSGIVYALKGEEFFIPWAFVHECNHFISLNISQRDLPKASVKEEILLKEYFLDRQIVDTKGLKIIRVNDILLTKIKGKLCIVSMDVGLKGIFRRVGFEFLNRLLLKYTKEKLVPWHYVNPLHTGIESIRLNIPQESFANIHPADFADLLEELSYRERANIFKKLDNRTAAKIIEESEETVQKSVIKSLKDKRAAAILYKMPRHKAADILDLIPAERKQSLLSILGNIDREAKEHIEYILGFSALSAGREMSRKFVAILPELTVGEAIAHLRSLPSIPNFMHYLYVISQGRLVGVVSLKQLVLFPHDAKISEIMEHRIIHLQGTETREKAVSIMAKYDFLSIPIVDKHKRMIGVIHVEEILEETSKESKQVMLQEIPHPKEPDAKSYFSHYLNIVKEIGEILKETDHIIRKQNVEKIIRKKSA